MCIKKGTKDSEMETTSRAEKSREKTPTLEVSSATKVQSLKWLRCLIKYMHVKIWQTVQQNSYYTVYFYE